jgi:HSP20 family protein
MNDVTTTPAKAVAKNPSTEVSPIGWIRNEIDRLFEDFGRPARSMFFNPPLTAPVAALELSEGKEEYKLSAELPGLSEDDVDIAVADGVLTISGEKKEEKERKENGYLMSERRYGSFRREIALPGDVDPNAIKAKFKNGVLSVTMAKDKNATPRTRKIAIEK